MTFNILHSLIALVVIMWFVGLTITADYVNQYSPNKVNKGLFLLYGSVILTVVLAGLVK